MRPIKYALSILFIFAIACSACRKHNNTNIAPINADYFIFGTVGGFCPTVCAKYFKIQGNQVFQSYVDSTDQIKYLSLPMPSDKYAIALPALTNFPSWFTMHPNTNIGCSGCADMSYLHFEYKKNGLVYQWNIDYPYEAMPTEIKSYTDQVYNIITSLQ